MKVHSTHSLAVTPDFHLFEDLQDPILFVNDEGSICHLNRACSRFLGYTPADLAGLPVWDVDETVREDIFVHEWNTVAKSRVVEFSSTIRRKDGRSIPVKVRVSMLPGCSDRYCMAVIRERDAATQGDQSAESNYELLPCPVLLLRGEAVWMNSAAERVLGHPRTAIVDSDSLFTTLFGDECAIARSLWEHDRATDFRGCRTLAVFHADGSTRTMEFRRSVGNAVEIWTLNEISELEAARSALQRSRTQHQRVAKATRDVLFEWNLDTDEFHWATPQNVFGHSAFTSDVHWWNDRIHPEDRNGVHQSLSAAFSREDNIWTCQYRFQRSDGTVAHLRSNAVVERNRHGKPIGITGALSDLSREKLLERQIDDDHGRWELAVRSANTGIWDWNIREHKHYVSPSWKTILGYEDHELKGEQQEWENLVHPDDLPRVWAVTKECLAGERRTFDEEYRMRAKDGSWKWIWDRATVQFDLNGAPVRMVGSHVDITERRSLEDKLRASESRFRSVAQALPDGIACYDSQYRYTYANDFLLETAELTAEEMLGKSDRELGLNAGPADRWEEFLRKAQEWADPIGEEFRIRGRYYHARAAAFADSHGSSTVVVLRDVTDMVRTREALDRKQTKLLHAQELGNMGSWQIDLETRIIDCSPQALRILGLPEGATSHQVLERVHPADRARLDHAFRTLLATEGKLDIEYRIVHANGKTRHVHSVGTLERDEVSSATRFSGILQDITDRTTHWQNVEDLNRALSRSNQELNQFAYSVSHDLQAPLRYLIHQLQFLRTTFGKDLSAGALEILEQTTPMAERMRALIQDLLAYSQALHPAELMTGTKASAEAALQWAIMNLSASVSETGAVITYDTLPIVRGDDSGLVQLFQNLLSNSLKYCTEKPIIHVSVKDEDMHFRFAIRDNGIGIAPQYHQRIFGLFQRLHGSEYPGTGIGLCLCARIVQNQGGQLWVDSAEGRGSTFYFTIPKE